MQYVEAKSNLTLNKLRQMVGASNVEAVLAINQLDRVPNIGQLLASRNTQAAQESKDVSTEYKKASLSKASQDSDVFESMALMGSAGWKIFKQFSSLPGTIKIPEAINLPLSSNVIGNSIRVASNIFNKVMKSLDDPPHDVDPEIFGKYSSLHRIQITGSPTFPPVSWDQFFKIPWGKMSIYSSIGGDAKDFPVYPEEMSDAVRANYTTMPEIIYQYEPWQLYTSSGPRTNQYTFMFHRDMWTGDHRDGKANELIRFCMANCYPEYNGSAVNTSLVTLYMNGQVLIRGVLTDVSTAWDGPLGLDGFYLVCKLTLSITEVSEQPLDYWSVRNKPLIG